MTRAASAPPRRKRPVKLRLFIDGAARGNPGPAGVGIVVQDSRGKTIAEVAEFLGRATNNVAEYRALIRALREARDRGADEIEIRSDSDLLVRQINGEYRVKSTHLAPLHHEAQHLLTQVRRWRVVFVPRSQNAAADALANRAIDDSAEAGNPGPAAKAATVAAAPGPRERPDLRADLRRLAASLDGQIGIGVKTTWDGATIFVQPDRPFPTASVFKIPVLIEMVLQAGEGRLSLDETVTVTEDLKSPGSGVLKELTSEPTLSLADLAMLMIIISDNSATDILVDRVGTEAINRRLGSWGFEVTRVSMTCRALLFELAGRPSGPFTPETRVEVERILKSGERNFTGRAYAEADNNVTTPREMIGLLEMLVTEGPIPPRARERILHFMRRQQIRDRLPLHLPPGTEIAHKTGSIAGVRNDAGILFLPNGPVLLCAFTRDLDRDIEGSAAIADVGRLVHEAYA